MIVRREGEWLSAQIDDELVMMNGETGDYVGLNAVGGRIWTMIETPRSVDQICAGLLAEFDVTAEDCRDQVERFLAELAHHGAVAVMPEL